MDLAFGPYMLVRRIAVGGMAEVYLARLDGPRGVEKQVVVKQILPQLARDPDLLQMFFDEAAIASKLSHPGIVQIFDFGQHSGTFYLAMEFVDGLDLDELIRVARRGGEPGRAVPVAHALYIASTLARCVHYAHEARDADGTPLEIIHRDISPQNVLLGRDGAVKLGDFGIARTKLRATRTQTGVLRGKIAYLAPERFAGEAASRSVDVYAMGVVLFEALSGRRPFTGDDAAFIKAIMTQEPPPLTAVVPGIDPRISAIVSRAISRTPEERFPTAEAFAREIEALQLSSSAPELADYVSAMCLRREAIRKEHQPQGAGTPPVTSKPKRATETLPGQDVRSPSHLDRAARGETSFGEMAGALLSESEVGEETVIDSSPPPELAPTLALPRPSRLLAMMTKTFHAPAVEDPGITRAMERPPSPGPQRLAVQQPSDPEPSASTAAASYPKGFAKKALHWIDAALEWGRVAPIQAIALVCGLGVVAGWILTVALFGEETVDPDAPLATAAPEGVVMPERRQERAGVPLELERKGELAPVDVTSRPPEPEREPEHARPPVKLEPIPVGVAPPLPEGDADAPREAPPVKEPAPVRIKRRPAVTAAAQQPRQVPRAAEGFGELSLDSEPWSYVTLEGRPLGPTPLAHVRLPAGRHRLVLQNPDSKLKRTLSISIKPDARTAMRVRLSDGKILGF